MAVAVQLSVAGLYLPPVLLVAPPHTIISLPVQTAVCESRAVGALATRVAIQLFVPGLYLPPVLKWVAKAGISTPDDHFTARPDCCMQLSPSRCVDRAST